ncbi:tail fiber domain-containing protein [Hymenobacter perfusus]|uniref:Peptidase S74 domain-containing protein n=1 Tax=Hymenobacter perfusus TaxID=1236770 RepID=A0A3R9MLS9_9BACT|nr:tail fiber domain-containing protein [Hymenobacter perfusus]RSK43428.1 hypothetical protein EI293_11065 [Hymenobacter perfusus]
MLNRYLLAPLTALLLLLAAPHLAQAQAGSVGIGTTTPNAAAALEVSSTTKGLLLPRLTLAQRDVLTASATAPPVAGLVIYQTDSTPGLYAYDGTTWVRLGNSNTDSDNLGDHTATQNINLNGNKLVGGTTARATRGGLGLDGNGLLTVGATRVHPDSTTTYGVRLTDLDQDFILTSQRFKGRSNPLNISGAGDRVMWLSYYSAFRAGGVTGNRWDYPNVGAYSVAFGLDNQASSDYTVAFGYNNRLRASDYTLATGYQNQAVLGYYGLLMGRENAYRGYHGIVGGYQSKTQTSINMNVPSLAFGYRCQARSSNSNCYALGYYARTGGFEGSFVLADFSPYRTSYVDDSLVSTTRNQFSARFEGGYRLFTTVATNGTNNGTMQTPVGVQLTSGSNAWTILSDSTKKERRVLADGNRFLESIGRMRLGSWNYKGQSPDTMRHYGPMAQDFYQAFGHDALGTIGNTTTINQADFDGVNLIAIQALYRRVLLLEAENAQQQQLIRQLQVTATTAAPAPVQLPVTEVEELRRQNAALQARAAAAETTAARATATLGAFEARLRRLEAATGGAPEPDAQARR